MAKNGYTDDSPNTCVNNVHAISPWLSPWGVATAFLDSRESTSVLKGQRRFRYRPRLATSLQASVWPGGAATHRDIPLRRHDALQVQAPWPLANPGAVLKRWRHRWGRDVGGGAPSSVDFRLDSGVNGGGHGPPSGNRAEPQANQLTPQCTRIHPNSNDLSLNPRNFLANWLSRQFQSAICTLTTRPMFRNKPWVIRGGRVLVGGRELLAHLHSKS